MYISEHDRDRYDQLAVRFYDYGKVEPTKTYNTLKERSERLERRYVEYTLQRRKVCLCELQGLWE